MANTIYHQLSVCSFPIRVSFCVSSVVLILSETRWGSDFLPLSSVPLVSWISSLNPQYAFPGYGTLLERSGDPLWSSCTTVRNNLSAFLAARKLRRFGVCPGKVCSLLWTLVLQAQQPVDSLFFTKLQMTRVNISAMCIDFLALFPALNW